MKGHHRNAVLLLAGISLALGAMQAWEWRGAMNPDGVAYLDEGDAISARR